MSRMFVVGEDAVCCALGVRLVADVLGWQLAQPAVNTKGGTKLQSELHRYAGLARLHPVLCLADTDGKCARELSRSWRPRNASNAFLLRFAVTEAESWLLADADALARYLDVPHVRVPARPDELADAKRAVLNLARRSRRRLIRQEMISSIDASKPGVGYNVHLRGFAMEHWRPSEAAQRSPSLQRAVRRLTELRVASR